MIYKGKKTLIRLYQARWNTQDVINFNDLVQNLRAIKIKLQVWGRGEKKCILNYC